MAQLILTSDQLQSLENRIRFAKVVGTDTEGVYPSVAGTKGTKTKRPFSVHLGYLVGASFAFEDGETFYLPVMHQGMQIHKPETVAKLWSFGAKLGVTWVLHNLKHDLHATGSRRLSGAFDTQVAAYLLGRPKLGLKELTGRKETFQEIAQGRRIDQWSFEEVCQYACQDAADVLALYRKFEPELRRKDLERAFELEMDLIPVLAGMERRGMYVDADGLDALYSECSIPMEAIADEWSFYWPGIKITSNKQVPEYFYGEGLWVKEWAERTKTGQKFENRDSDDPKFYSTNHASLEPQLNSPSEEGAHAAELLMAYKEYQKIASTYSKTLATMARQQPDGRIRTNFNQTVARTGRLSSSVPNLQNIPVRTELGRKVKALFIPEPGNVFVSADYSQIELRVMAHFAGGTLAKAYQEGADVHQQTADLMGVSRDAAKTGNFAKLYRAGPRKLAKAMGVPLAEAQQFNEDYDKAMPEIARCLQKMVDAATERGYIKTLIGRRRYIHELTSKDKFTRFRGERIAGNTPIQGGAGDIVKLGMIAADRAGLPIIGQVHDEVLLEVKESEASDAGRELQRCLEGAYRLSVPLEAKPKTGRTWLECK